MNKLEEKSLQRKMKYLLHTKRKILKRKFELAASLDKSAQCPGDTHFQTLYENKSPLMTDVHLLELKQLELNENLRLDKTEKERQILRKQIELAVCSDDGKPLLKWYREIKSCPSEQQGVMFESDQQFLSPSYDVGNNGIEALKFSTCYKGVVLFIELNHRPSTQNDEPAFSVKSDIYLSGLEKLLSTCVMENKSPKNFVERVWEQLEGEVLQCL